MPSARSSYLVPSIIATTVLGRFILLLYILAFLTWLPIAWLTLKFRGTTFAPPSHDTAPNAIPPAPASSLVS